MSVFPRFCFILCGLILPLKSQDIEWSTALNLPSPAASLVPTLECRLAVDSKGLHHYVESLQNESRPRTMTAYIEQMSGGNTTLPLEIPSGTFAINLDTMLSSPLSGVSLFCRRTTFTSGGIVAYHLSGPTPADGRLVPGIPANSVFAAFVDQQLRIILAHSPSTGSSVGTSEIIFSEYDPVRNEITELSRFTLSLNKRCRLMHIDQHRDGQIRLYAVISQPFETSFVFEILQWDLADTTLERIDSGITVANAGVFSSSVSPFNALSSATENNTPILTASVNSSSLLTFGFDGTSESWMQLPTLSFSSVGPFKLFTNEFRRASLVLTDIGSNEVKLMRFGAGAWSEDQVIPDLSFFTCFAAQRSGYLHAGGFTTFPSLGQRTLRFQDLTDPDGDGFTVVEEDFYRTTEGEIDIQDVEIRRSSNSRLVAVFNIRRTLDRNGTLPHTFDSRDGEFVALLETSENLTRWRDADSELDTDLFVITGRGSVISSEFQPPATRRFVRLRPIRIR